MTKPIEPKTMIAFNEAKNKLRDVEPKIIAMASVLKQYASDRYMLNRTITRTVERRRARVC